jgi:hypothetical protein
MGHEDYRLLDKKPCRLVDRYQRYSESLVTIYKTTRCYITGESNLHCPR